MASCSYLKPDGGRCRAAPMKGEAWCYVHHPELEDKRRAASRRGGQRAGRGRPTSGMAEIAAIKADLLDDIGALRDGNLQPGRAAVLFQGHNARLRAEAEWRKTMEQEEIIPRLEALEQQEPAGSGLAWQG